jgi:hypothetical protein
VIYLSFSLYREIYLLEQQLNQVITSLRDLQIIGEYFKEISGLYYYLLAAVSSWGFRFG